MWPHQQFAPKEEVEVDDFKFAEMFGENKVWYYPDTARFSTAVIILNLDDELCEW